MEIASFAIITLLLGVVALVTRADVAIISMMCLFVANAAGTVAFSGISIPPANLFLLFYGTRVLLRQRGLSDCIVSLKPPDAGFWLLILVIYGLMTAFIYPRLFSGMTYILYTDKTLPLSMQGLPRPLAPGSGNFTQSIYLFGALCVYATTRAYKKAVSSDVFLSGFLVLALFNIAFAVIDILTYSLGISFAMDFMRSGGYEIHAGQEFGGYRRVVGAFPEPSTFASFSFQMFVAMFVMWLKDWGGPTVIFAMIANLIFLIVSTSTVGYVALSVFVGFLIVWFFFSIFSGRVSNKLFKCFALVIFGLTCVFSAHLMGLLPKGVYEVIDQTLNKSQSASGIERAMMNAFAWSNFMDTSGMGVGLGSARASSFLFATFSNLGLIGIVLFSAYVVTLLFSTPSQSDAVVTAVAKSQIIAVLIVASSSGAVFDLGSYFYLCCGLVTAAERVDKAEAPA